MENVIYSKTIASARELDSDESNILYLTQENNGYAIFTSGFSGTEFVKWFSGKNQAIEYAVGKAQELREGWEEQRLESPAPK